MFWKLTAAALIILVALAGPVGAVVHNDALDYEVRLPQSQVAPIYTQPSDAEALELLPALADFRSQEGAGWKLLSWNPMSSAPSAIGGPAIPVTSSDASEQAIRSSVEAFLSRNAEMLKLDPQALRFNDIVEIRDGRRVAFLDQTYEGLDVIFGRVDVAMQDGKIVLVGPQIYPNIEVNRFPLVDEMMAARAAHLGIPDHQEDAVEGTPRLVVLPLHEDGSIEYHLAWEIFLRTNDPENVWRTYVDAHDGDVLWRQSEYAFYEIPGNVTGWVEENFGELYDYPLYRERVRAGGTYSDYTDANGGFSVTVPNNANYTMDTELLGSYCNVYRADGTDAALSTTAGPSDYVEFYYDDANSDRAERDAYYHVNVVHEWIKGVDPTFTDLDYSMSARVNLNDTCNAYWDGSRVNFFRAGDGCNATGRISDVIYHEYGHGITQEIYSPYGAPTWSGMGEAFSDTDAMCIHPDPLVGEYFFTSGTPVRDAENLRQYPGTECGGQVHCLGEILMGSMWKSWVLFEMKYGEEAARTKYDHLYVDTRKTKQNNMPAFLTNMLMINDDDADLTNGTPDWFEICDAFAIHNLPCPPLSDYVEVTSDPIPDQQSLEDPYVITATVLAVGGSAIDPATVEIHYTTEPIDENPTWLTVPMSATVNPDEYQGEIPNQGCGELIHYYVQAAKYTGEVSTAPQHAPYREVYNFMVGPTLTSIDDDLEADQGWTLGWTGDDATDGLWERVDPELKETPAYGEVQPDDDHTASGTLCFVTNGVGGAFFSGDVDAGITSVVSPVFDWSTATGYATVQFWSHLFDGPQNDDFFRVWVSNDNGVVWKEIWNISPGLTENDWKFRKVYFDETEIAFTDQMRFRFTMEDVFSSTSGAEASVDDIVIRVNQCNLVGVEDGQIPLSFTVEQNRPNPFNPRTAIRFGLPSEGMVDVSIFDASGRKIRTLLDDQRTAGYHTVVWDGRDDLGHSVGSGVYYYTVNAGENAASNKMMLLK